MKSFTSRYFHILLIFLFIVSCKKGKSNNKLPLDSLKKDLMAAYPNYSMRINKPFDYVSSLYSFCGSRSKVEKNRLYKIDYNAELSMSKNGIITSAIDYEILSFYSLSEIQNLLNKLKNSNCIDDSAGKINFYRKLSNKSIVVARYSSFDTTNFSLTLRRYIQK